MEIPSFSRQELLGLKKKQDDRIKIIKINQFASDILNKIKSRAISGQTNFIIRMEYGNEYIPYMEEVIPILKSHLTDVLVEYKRIETPTMHGYTVVHMLEINWA